MTYYSIDRSIYQIVGPSALILETLTEAQVAAQATTTLRSMFGTANVPEPIGCSFSRWAGDVFARGSYTQIPYHHGKKKMTSAGVCVDVGTSLSLPSSSLSSPNKEGHGSDDNNDGAVDGNSTYNTSLRSSIIMVDRYVHYAGEANYPDYRGTVHGAYISGTEAAYRVIAIDCDRENE